MKTYIVWTKGSGWFSRQVSRLTRPSGWNQDNVPSHVLIMFGDGLGYEAHAHTGGWNRIWALELAIWLTDDRRAWHLELPSSHTEYWRARCEQQVGFWPYDIVSCIRFLGWRWFHLPWRRCTAGAVTCGEAVSRILFDAYDIPPKLGYRPGQHDRVVPVDLMRALPGDIIPGLPPTPEHNLD